MDSSQTPPIVDKLCRRLSFRRQNPSGAVVAQYPTNLRENLGG